MDCSVHNWHPIFCSGCRDRRARLYHWNFGRCMRLDEFSKGNYRDFHIRWTLDWFNDQWFSRRLSWQETRVFHIRVIFVLLWLSFGDLSNLHLILLLQMRHRCRPRLRAIKHQHLLRWNFPDGNKRKGVELDMVVRSYRIGGRMLYVLSVHPRLRALALAMAFI